MHYFAERGPTFADTFFRNVVEPQRFEQRGEQIFYHSQSRIMGGSLCKDEDACGSTAGECFASCDGVDPCRSRGPYQGGSLFRGSEDMKVEETEAGPPLPHYVSLSVAQSA